MIRMVKLVSYSEEWCRNCLPVSDQETVFFQSNIISRKPTIYLAVIGFIFIANNIKVEVLFSQKRTVRLGDFHFKFFLKYFWLVV